jgi:hypothetical protein
MGVVLLQRRAAQQEAMRCVLTLRTSAREHASRWVGTGVYRHSQFIQSIYVPEIEKINPLACPDIFRNTWINYVQAWERQKDPVLRQQESLRRSATSQHFKVAAHDGLSSTGGELSFGSEHPNLEHAAEDLAKEDNNEQWLACKRVAMEYGVFVPGD